MTLRIRKLGSLLSGTTRTYLHPPLQASAGFLNTTHVIRWQQHRLGHESSRGAPTSSADLSGSTAARDPARDRASTAARDRAWQVRNAVPIAKARERFQTHNFVDHYDRLGLGPLTPAEEVRGAFFPLAKKFHPDLKGSDAQVDATKFREIHESRQFLLDSEKKRAYDATYMENYEAMTYVRRDDRIRRHLREAAQGGKDPVEKTDLESNSPNRKRCNALMYLLPAHTTPRDIVRAIAAIGQPIGRVLHITIRRQTQQLRDMVTLAAIVEFATETSAEAFFRVASSEKRFHVLGKTIDWVDVHPPAEAYLARHFGRSAVDPHASRLLLIGGPGQEPIMTAKGMREFLGTQFTCPLADVEDYVKLWHMTDGSGDVALEFCFTTFRGGAVFAYKALKRHYPHLKLGFGKDPCA